MALPVVSGEGLVVQDPELKFTPAGDAVISIRVKSSARKLNQQTNQWEDGDTSFFNVTAWRGVAENAAEVVKNGDVITFGGGLHVREYQKQDGTKGLSVEVKATSIGLTVPSKVTAKPQQQAAPQQQNPYAQPQNPYAQQAAPNPYAQQPNPYAQPGAPVQQPVYQQPPAQQQPQQQPPAQDPWATPGQQFPAPAQGSEPPF